MTRFAEQMVGLGGWGNPGYRSRGSLNPGLHAFDPFGVQHRETFRGAELLKAGRE